MSHLLPAEHSAFMDHMHDFWWIWVIGVLVVVWGLILVIYLRDRSGFSEDVGFFGVFVSVVVIVFFGVSWGFYAIDEETHGQEQLPLTMECGEWQQFFLHSAYADDLRFWSGGDTQNGELALYFQRESEKRDPCLETFPVERKYWAEVCKYDKPAYQCMKHIMEGE